MYHRDRPDVSRNRRPVPAAINSAQPRGTLQSLAELSRDGGHSRALCSWCETLQSRCLPAGSLYPSGHRQFRREVSMAEFKPTKTVTDFKHLDEGEVLEGYFDGFHGGSAPGSDRSRSFWHGWRNGRVDAGLAAP